MRLIFTVVCFTLHFFALCQNSLSDEIANWATQQSLYRSQVGVAVHDVYTGSAVGSYNADKFMIPASSLKVFTSLTTLALLGKDFRYQTKLCYDGTIVDSILHGNVYIVGSGDPSLGAKRYSDKPNLQQLVSLIVFKIKAQGIKSIQGSLIADCSIFDNQPVYPTWEWGDLGRGYAAGTWGLNVNENEYDIWYDVNQASGNVATIQKIFPEIKEITLQNAVVIAPEDTNEKVYLYGGPGITNQRVTGTIPRDNDPYRIDGGIPDPPRLLARLVYDELQKNQIPVYTFDVQYYRTSMQQIAFDSIPSVPLIDLVKQANYHSINQYCDAFVKTLGYKKGYRGSGAEGLAQIKNFIQHKGVDIYGINLEDGSGLSARNLTSSTMLSSFLAGYAKEYGFDYTASLLPKAGEQGTVRRMLKGMPSQGSVWAKTGTISRVITYTGLIKAKSGRWVSFSIMVNHHEMPNIDLRKNIALLIDKIYERA